MCVILLHGNLCNPTKPKNKYAGYFTHHNLTFRTEDWRERQQKKMDEDYSLSDGKCRVGGWLKKKSYDDSYSLEGATASGGGSKRKSSPKRFVYSSVFSNSELKYC